MIHDRRREKHWMNTGERVVQQKKKVWNREIGVWLERKRIGKMNSMQPTERASHRCHPCPQVRTMMITVAIHWLRYSKKKVSQSECHRKCCGFLGNLLGLQCWWWKASSKSKQRVHRHQSTGSSRMVVCLFSEPIRTRRSVWPLGQQAS